MNLLLGISLWMVLINTACGSFEGSLVGHDQPTTSQGAHDRTLVDRLRSMSDSFATTFYNQLLATQPPNANVFFSPFSIYAALLMTYLGAQGETRKELGGVLGLSQEEIVRTSTEPDFVNKQFLKFISDIFAGGSGNASANNGGNYKLDFANRLCVQDNMTIQPSFTELLKKFHNSDIKRYDFGTQAEAARLDVNAWVGNVTRGKIANLLPPGTVDAQTFLILVNAIYFKANWMTQFEASATQDAKFFTAGADTFRQVRLMTTKRRVFYLYDKTLKAQIVEIPYQSEELSMVVMLPRALTGMEDLLAGLTAQKWKELQDRMDMALVELKLPRFRLETSYDLVGALSGLGATHLFAGADLSGMLEAASSVTVSGVVHKAFVGKCC
ncbi:putative Serpin B4 [Hypsibius exemplaris]|uniref:Serpin B4 n=1 Tax=Hypsibius exemplaris TaxID=2072580 RepID=A0A1W0WRY9_HYPEX|nr:putative Serpin B4 [Hypsibius exemplaris]